MSSAYCLAPSLSCSFRGLLLLTVCSEKIEEFRTFLTNLASVHPETPEDASWSFQFINEQFAARSRKSRDCAEAYFTYVAQEIPKIDVETAAKDHLWMETR